MTIREISIFVQNKKGKLAAISKLMGDNGVNIRGFTMADTAEGYGIFKLIVDYTDKAEELLKKNQYTVSLTEVLAVKIKDKPRALYEVLKSLSDSGINLDYIYAVANSYIVIKCDDAVKAAGILKEEKVEVIENTMEI